MLNRIKLTLLAFSIAANLPAVVNAKLLSTDQWLFEELNGLVNRSVISLNLSTYPLSRSEILRALREANPENQSDLLVIHRIKEQLAEKRDGFTLEAEMASQLPKLQTGKNNLYDQYRYSAIQSFGTENLDFRLQLNYNAGDSAIRSKNWDMVGSYAAFKLWNQWISIGQQKRFWGTAHSGSLILGDSARPVIGINMQRDKQDPFESKWLSWLGRWQYQFFIGQALNFDGMLSPQNHKLIGMRLAIIPMDYLELGASRIFQWGGNGRLQTLSSFANAFLGKDNAGTNVSTDKEPGNQIAGVDFRIRFKYLLGLPISFYGQVMGEDEANYLPSQHFYLLGIDGSHNISHRQTLNYFIEGVDTSIDLGRKSGITYRHSIYRDGYYHQRLPLGYALGGDMRALVVGFNSSYRNNDITALVRDHRWSSKFILAHNVVKDNSQVAKESYQGIELQWQGNIPINRYIGFQLQSSVWHLKAKNDKNQSGIALKAALAF